MEEDSYKTIAGPSRAVFRERGSKFYAYAWPVADEAQIKEHLDVLRKEYYDATHHCYAWRLGPEGERERANDDGEPSGSAGRPILGQMLSAGVTNLLIVVVRYFGGTKLGVPGLINSYRESARAALDKAQIIERTVDIHFKVRFSYPVMNDVMRVVKEVGPTVVSQSFDNVCEMELSIRRARSMQLADRLEKCEGAEVESLGER
ncbi:YigZ family protein [Alistipes sp. OttesenSCG-928-B03]|nr:YigZ family protein [Alistipes sp. OttesenSCG-928-B03]